MPQANAKPRRAKAARWLPEDRRRQILRVACRLIADKGIEALRTRDIAGAAKINIATLHYYFPTKEALVQAVIADSIDQFRTAREVRHPPIESARQELRLEMQDVRTRLVSAQEQLAVLTELAILARRDPAVAQILKRMDQGWHRQLSEILQRGKKSGEFRRDLDVAATARAVMTQLRSLGYLIEPKQAEVLAIFDQIVAQIERWLEPG